MPYKMATVIARTFRKAKMRLNWKRNICLIFFTILLFLPVSIFSEEWTQWEKSHAIARMHEWLVICVPEKGGCYIKQSFKDPKKMEISMDSEQVPCIWGPFFKKPVDVEFRLQADQGPVVRIKRSNVTNGIRLPQSILPALRRGFVLKVKIQVPEDKRDQLLTYPKQKFNLRGFTAASELLNSSRCK